MKIKGFGGIFDACKPPAVVNQKWKSISAHAGSISMVIAML
jgi:hypothetical protein